MHKQQNGTKYGINAEQPRNSKDLLSKLELGNTLQNFVIEQKATSLSFAVTGQQFQNVKDVKGDENFLNTKHHKI